MKLCANSASLMMTGQILLCANLLNSRSVFQSVSSDAAESDDNRPAADDASPPVQPWLSRASEEDDDDRPQLTEAWSEAPEKVDPFFRLVESLLNDQTDWEDVLARQEEKSLQNVVQDLVDQELVAASPRDRQEAAQPGKKQGKTLERLMDVLILETAELRRSVDRQLVRQQRFDRQNRRQHRKKRSRHSDTEEMNEKHHQASDTLLTSDTDLRSSLTSLASTNSQGSIIPYPRIG